MNDGAGTLPLEYGRNKWADADLLRTVVRDLAPRRVGGPLDHGDGPRLQAFTAAPFLTVDQWAAIDRALKATS